MGKGSGRDSGEEGKGLERAMVFMRMGMIYGRTGLEEAVAQGSKGETGVERESRMAKPGKEEVGHGRPLAIWVML